MLCPRSTHWQRFNTLWTVPEDIQQQYLHSENNNISLTKICNDCNHRVKTEDKQQRAYKTRKHWAALPLWDVSLCVEAVCTHVCESLQWVCAPCAFLTMCQFLGRDQKSYSSSDSPAPTDLRPALCVKRKIITMLKVQFPSIAAVTQMHMWFLWPKKKPLEEFETVDICLENCVNNLVDLCKGGGAALFLLCLWKSRTELNGTYSEFQWMC